uniref:TPR_REGION domain-containing protein n=1 Tax=Panagrellus redivivus TaxID=6233 RepID=A0A7E4ULN2_PANRE
MSKLLITLMVAISLLTTLLVSSCTIAVANASHRQPKLSDYDTMRVDDKKHFPVVKNMHLNWYGHSIKALIGQLGQDLYSKLSASQQHSLANCLDRIEDKKDLVLSARCIVKARNNFKNTLKTRVFSKPQRKWYPPPNVPRIELPKLKLKKSRFEKYRLRRFKRSYNDYKTAEIRHRSVKKLDKLAHSSRKSPISKVTDLLSIFVPGGLSHRFNSNPAPSRPSWSATYKKLSDAKTKWKTREESPAAKTYNLRMYDIVLGKERPSLSPKERSSPLSLLPNAMNMLSQLTGQKHPENTDSGNTKWLSPRFAPLMPDRMKSPTEILSPTFFALYDEKNVSETRSIGNVPNLLKTLGVSASDRDSIIDLIMEASGTRKSTEEALSMLDSLDSKGINGPIYAATEKMSDAFKSLESSLTPDQVIERDHKGFTFMERHQMEKLYRDQGIDAASTSFDLDAYANLTKEERMEALWSRVERIALNVSDESFTRSKRQINWLSVLAPVILAPYMFAPVFGFGVLGPVILSPNIFSPLILNPAVLGPYILSPAVAMPFILSPYLLSPYILTPIVMAPFILNPYVLSPNILNPYVLSPLILSPLVLCPDVLSPQVLGGPVLSPSVLSPAVLTESFLMANVLSPSFLS